MRKIHYADCIIAQFGYKQALARRIDSQVIDTAAYLAQAESWPLKQ